MGNLCTWKIMKTIWRQNVANNGESCSMGIKFWKWRFVNESTFKYFGLVGLSNSLKELICQKNSFI